jgi:hypothetical protein
MKTILVSIPSCSACHAINGDDGSWKNRFLQLVRGRTPISFRLSMMAAVLEFEAELDAAGYEHQILSTDCQRHFLIPVREEAQS